MRKLCFRVPGVADPVCVEVERVGGGFLCRRGSDVAEVACDQVAGGGRLLRIHGRIIPFHATRDGDSIRVWMKGRSYALEIADATRRRASAGPTAASEEIIAPMPGTILKILVGAGRPFAAHQPLIIMESMKMEMTLSSPHDGRVRELLCSVGELVVMGKVLAKLETGDNNDPPR